MRKKSVYMRPGYSGFTLLELMIVLAVIGILSSLALPSYQDYTIRAKVAEGLGFAAPVKLAVADKYIETYQFPDGKNANYGLPDGNSYATKNIDSIEIGDNGVITINYGEIGGKADFKSIILNPTTKHPGSIKWDCVSVDMPLEYLPSTCNELYVASAASDSSSSTAPPSSSSASKDAAADKASKKAAREARKAAKKAAREARKAAKKAAREARKAAKKAAKEAKKNSKS